MPKLDTHAPHLVDIFRRANLEREHQDQRIADIFGTQTVPKVTEETLAIDFQEMFREASMPLCPLAQASHSSGPSAP